MAFEYAVLDVMSQFDLGLVDLLNSQNVKNPARDHKEVEKNHPEGKYTTILLYVLFIQKGNGSVVHHKVLL